MATKHFGSALRKAVLKVDGTIIDVAGDLGLSRAYLYKLFEMPSMDDVTVGIANRIVSYFPQLRCFLCAAKHAAEARHSCPAGRA